MQVSLQAMLDAVVEKGEPVDVMALADALSEALPDQRCSLLAVIVARLRAAKGVILPIPGDRCAYEGCKELAITAATGKGLGADAGHHPLGRYCESHARAVSDEGDPEYVEWCPNCGCRFGVN